MRFQRTVELLVVALGLVAVIYGATLIGDFAHLGGNR
jgi:hypothetical protein